MKRTLVALLAAALLGLAACSPVQSGGELPAEGEPPPTSSASAAPTAVLPGAGQGTETGAQPPLQETPAGEGSPPAETGSTDGAGCMDGDPHPIGLSIAGDYDVPYEQVMEWFCSGYSFENILVALETGEAVDIPPETLLLMLLDKEWEEIWDEIGFVEDS